MVTRLRWIQYGLLATGLACGASSEDVTTLRLDGAEQLSAVWNDDVDSGTRGAEFARQYPIAFVSDRSGSGREELYLMSLDRGGHDAVLVSSGEDQYVPRWAPDASSILARRVVDGASADLGLIAPDGSQLVLLTQSENPLAFAYPPNWSPDGEQISFASMREDGTHVWVVSRSGGTAERLLPDLDAEHREAAWSPDGSRIAYSAQTGMGRRRDLFVRDVGNPATEINLTRGRVYAPGFYRWSPDGTRIAFSSATTLDDGSPESGAPLADGTYVPPDMEIFVIDVESTALTRLSDNGGIDLAPAWSPDGTELLFSSDRDGDGDLWIIPADGSGEPRNIIDDGEGSANDDSLADWYGGLR